MPEAAALQCATDFKTSDGESQCGQPSIEVINVMAFVCTVLMLTDSGCLLLDTDGNSHLRDIDRCWIPSAPYLCYWLGLMAWLCVFTSATDHLASHQQFAFNLKCRLQEIYLYSPCYLPRYLAHINLVHSVPFLDLVRSSV